MIHNSGRGTACPTPQRIISMSLTEVSLGKLLASRACLRFARPCQLTKRDAASHNVASFQHTATCRPATKTEENVTFLMSQAM